MPESGQKERRRAQILEVAGQVFAELGYPRTTIDEIATRTGVARGTFYLYFDSKNAIFHELLDLLLARLRENVVGIDVAEGAPLVRDQLLGTVRRVLDAFRENPAFAKLVMKEAVGVDAEIDKKLEAFDNQLHDWLADALAIGAEMGLIRAIDPEMVAWLILGSFKQCMSLVLERPDDELDLDHLSEVILDYNLQGVRVVS